MSTSPRKFQFLFRTNLGTGRVSETVLAETESRDRATMLRGRFLTLSGKMVQGKKRRNVVVKHVEPARFVLFAKPEACPAIGQVFSSVDALAQQIDAHPGTVRATLSRAAKAGEKTATLRGVTYAYVA